MNLPQARKADLIIEELSEETLVYDLLSHQAHSLNPSSAVVWRHCNGASTVKHVASILSRQFETEVSEDLVRLALQKLASAGLLEAPVIAEISRRQALRKLAIAGGFTLALPAIHSIIAPMPAQAQTCINPGGGGTDAPCIQNSMCCNNNCDVNLQRCI